MVENNQNEVFHLATKNTSYILRVDESKHLRHEYFGGRIKEKLNYNFAFFKENFPRGSAVVYDEKKYPGLSYDQIPLELGLAGKGDYREPSIVLDSLDQSVFDFKVTAISEEKEFIASSFPSPHHPDQVLIIELTDDFSGVKLMLQYGVFESVDVIVRNITIENGDNKSIRVRKIMSYNLDFANHNYELWTTYGSWINEFNIAKQEIKPGIYTNDSKTGSSSSRHNPFYLIKEAETTMNQGPVYGFNLVYSGNHYSAVELSAFNNLRIQGGINPFDFQPILERKAKLEMPFAIMTFSNLGINGMSDNFHRFIRKHIVRSNFAYKPRPIVINNWEATYFAFSDSKIKSIMDGAKKMGLEMFVLDDGWFGKRNNDLSGLGDWNVNTKKLHHGLQGVAKSTSKRSLSFGLWFEPEMVNEDSDLYRAHPDWAIQTKYASPSVGRHQLILDLSREEVQDYVIESVSKHLRKIPIKYVKWDFNRTISDGESKVTPALELTYRYYVGLYRVLAILTKNFPDVIFENCASGGGRFDLGMLSYFDQTWASDNTDGYERIKIQSGTALAYPLSTISNHVSATPSHQMLRITSFYRRFVAACFGVMGYELEISGLSPIERRWMKKNIAFYKKHRLLFQFGKFYQMKAFSPQGDACFVVENEDKSEAIIGCFYGLQLSAPGNDFIQVPDLDKESLYQVEVLPNPHRLKTFGGLLKMALPSFIKPDGAIVNYLNQRKSVEEIMKLPYEEKYIIDGASLGSGALQLNPQWMGNGFNEKTRVLGDFGADLIYVKKIK
jgi:alpha-galactosidase